MRELKGAPVAAAQQETTAKKIRTLAAKGVTPGLAIVRFSADRAAQMYGDFLAKSAAQAGLYVERVEPEENLTQEDALATIHALNQNPQIDGILLLMPLPPGLDRSSLVEAIAPGKDIDGLTPTQVGRLVTGRTAFVPATARAVLATLRHYEIPLAGKHAVVIGRSDVIGKPVAQLLLAANATVTICHSKTQDLPNFTRAADILVAAVGKAMMVTPDMVGEDAVVVDVGIHRVDGKTVGDVAPEALAKAQAATPVPGGIGSVTTALMLDAAVTAALRHHP
ncbi:MAG: bifunctional 5,10-methylenetetrahydrofolate dehydrogenase/5,10-methenyltetrahydrofolate cyclohydrolase [Negativicoccus succinicivorans]|uniref:bifunctional 5,10-methylenetetrahydrofolate dehydrogenase/5,10-methenyltetrahydrofolate cyclohydrolase n=1 Tax=Negativicoccus succinicivorans TaxID=620903 RepID=UPI0029082CFC|nr:bifunctional 5,10-methylenetetrahydrofolate dehydrogenase/5,10-methenyltetrahydrofolate cyclohydrolase [Negativicoccus succinicivorans]MDU4558402.1 bifunctional 5,10-methylenetetrahydrofolate dehydrogenase/5,10-methenyltetrahydrofolate cyclohydrolase [Negativicoccus succinicivorans]MDU4576354.1 bifunctional 5,10-methylenetetrahydrofolate dehydrogenase/5,10-methenyltetrahydrofolate cyclohydrolase [Negativicoccus succinicivorans]